MDYKGLHLDAFQEQAIHAIEHNKSVVVSAPTGSGKTLIADYIINRDVKKGIRVIYTAPIKALSNQKYKEFSHDYGEKNVGLLTGDIVKNPDALIMIMTTEIYRNMTLSNDPALHDVSYVIFDEIHYINDVDRGYVWEESIIFSNPHIRMLCLSATIPNADEFAQWMQAIKDHEVTVIRHDIRSVPLETQFYDSELGITTLRQIRDVIDIPDERYLQGRTHRRRPLVKRVSHIDLIKEIQDKLPCLYFAFSRIGCQQRAVELTRKNFFPVDSRISPLVRHTLSKLHPDINKLESTQLLRQMLPYGIGFHHAGLIPVMKELVEDLFGQGLIKVLYTTETFAVGINFPVKTVCIDALHKFDGRTYRWMNTKEFFQIAGRAGRRGIDQKGYVYVAIDRKDFEFDTIKKLTHSDTAPLKSQFKLSVNTVLNLVKLHTPEEINRILCMSFHSFQKYGRAHLRTRNERSHHTFENSVRKLEKLGYIKNGRLTDKGMFASQIYANEILISEIFGGKIYTKLNEYQMLLILASICYEAREKTVVYEHAITKDVRELKRYLEMEGLAQEPLFQHLFALTGLVHPLYLGKPIFTLIKNTAIPEGDLVRFLRQILDRINQIKAATPDDSLRRMLLNCQEIVINCLKDVEEL